jgi:hypothetical protein
MWYKFEDVSEERTVSNLNFKNSVEKTSNIQSAAWFPGLSVGP